MTEREAVEKSVTCRTFAAQPMDETALQALCGCRRYGQPMMPA